MLTRILFALVLLALPATAQDVQGNIVTGGPNGTYIRIGRDIAQAAADCGVALNVNESAGSIENMQAVRDRRLTQFGIVQSDVLEYFRTFEAQDPALARAARGIRIAFPLYNEEVHVIARRDVAALEDLAGRRVATGVAGSGTRLTADLILDLTQVEPAERVELGPEAALEALVAGEVDAFFYVVGAPAPLIADPRLDPASFHLLPLTEPVLTDVYSPTQIAAGTYPLQDGPVDLVAVKAALVTFDFDPRQNAYQSASCDLVSDVSHLILTRFDALREQGHPKWRAVDPRDIPPGWEVSACVLRGLDPAYAFTCRRPDGTEVQEGVSGDDPNRLFIERVCGRAGC